MKSILLQKNNDAKGKKESVKKLKKILKRMAVYILLGLVYLIAITLWIVIKNPFNRC